MGWRIFDSDADRYEAWYASPKGQRAERSERRLLGWLLQKMPPSASILEIGCGTGRFTSWFAEQGHFAVGLERAPAMLATLRRLRPTLPTVQGNAHTLPFQDGAVEVTVFVTALEFLERPEAALTEAVRASREGLVIVVLNSCSAGGFSRRWGRRLRGHKLAQARDYNLWKLLKLVRAAASDRLLGLGWRSALYPYGPAE